MILQKAWMRENIEGVPLAHQAKGNKAACGSFLNFKNLIEIDIDKFPASKVCPVCLKKSHSIIPPT
jgi:hypothetical protein